MKRVQLIVTGEMEKSALHCSLASLFPFAEFKEPQRMDGFTSCSLKGDFPQAPRHGRPTKPTIKKLADALIAAVEPGRRKSENLDLVIVVEDLELCNIGQPSTVTELFRRAVNEELDARNFNGDSRSKAEEKLRTRCSFHLFSPMTEAYFFGEKAALKRADAERRNLFSAQETDIEQFHVVDPDYLNVAEGLRPWAKPQRESHPKHYLGFLCTPMADSLSVKSEEQHYRETKQGRAALKELDWKTVLAHPKKGTFARSFIEDIADAIEVKNPAPGDCAPETKRKDHGLLRNL